MALIKSCRNNTPQISDSCWLADNATIVGDVKMVGEAIINDCILDIGFPTLSDKKNRILYIKGNENDGKNEDRGKYNH